MKKDILIISLFLGIIAVATVSLLIDFSTASRRATTEEIGRITFKRKTAQRKYFEQPIWEFLYKDSPVYNKDKIRTSEDSLSIIYFSNGAEIELDENTLVYLDMKDDQPLIDFTEGSIRTRKGSNESNLTITSEGTEVKLANADAFISRGQNSEIRIDVTEGSATVISNGSTSEIKANQSALLSSGSVNVSDQSTISEAPRPGSYMITENEKKDVTFKWHDSAESITGVEVYNAQTSQRETPSPEKDEEGNYTKSLTPGEYYWQLTKDDGSATPPRKFTIIKDAPPVTVNPREKKEFHYYANRPSVFFSWQGTDTATSYNLEISRTSDFTAPAFSIETTEQSITVPSLDEGKWYWRVKNRYTFGGITEQLVSPVATFSIGKSNSVSPPELYSPGHENEITGDYFSRNSLLFNWEQNNDLNEYIFELSQSLDFSQPIIRQQTRAPYYRLERSLPAGHYFWRISYQNPISGELEYTANSSFIVSSNSRFSPLFPEQEAAVPLSDTVSLVWNDSSNWGNYRVDVSRNEDFSHIHRSYTSTSKSVQVNARQHGKWFWRVIKIPESPSHPPIVSSFVVATPLSAPSLNSPDEGQRFDMSSRNDLRFSWNGVTGATSYNISIYDSQNVLVYHETTADTSIVITDLSLFDRGNFILELYAETSGSNARISPAVKRRFTLILPTLGRPELITRELYYAE